MVVIVPATQRAQLPSNIKSVPAGAQPADSANFTQLFYKDEHDAVSTQPKSFWDYCKDIFLHLGYFTYDAFLLLTQSFPALANFSQKNKFIKWFSIAVELLCSISNTWIAGSKTFSKTHSIAKTTFMVLEEGIVSLLLGLILPGAIIHGTQKGVAKVFKFMNHPFGRLVSGLLAIFGIDRSMYGCDRLAEKAVYENAQGQQIADRVDGFLAQKGAA